jgi:hypothetical protein
MQLLYLYPSIVIVVYAEKLNYVCIPNRSFDTVEEYWELQLINSIIVDDPVQLTYSMILCFRNEVHKSG